MLGDVGPLLLDMAEAARHRVARRALILAACSLAIYVFMLGALGSLAVAMFILVARHRTPEEAALAVAGVCLLGAVLASIPIVRWVRHKPRPLPPPPVAGADAPLAAAPPSDPLSQALAHAAVISRMRASELLIAGSVAGFVYGLTRERRRDRL